MARLFRNAVEMSHRYVSEVVGTGDRVVDATVGNGGDTVFLANLVGEKGQVIGFDIQATALEKVDAFLKQQGLCQRVILKNCGHQMMKQYVSGEIQACMFNLGYLPGSSHDLVTLPHTTRAAVEQALELLKPGGIITVVVYTGHQGGAEEAAVIEEMIAILPQEQWDVTRVSFPNRRSNPPYLITIQKR